MITTDFFDVTKNIAARGRAEFCLLHTSPPPRAAILLPELPDTLNVCFFSLEQAGRGRGVVARGRAGGPPARGAAANRAGRGGAAGARGAARQAARGVGRAKGSLPGNEYFVFLYFVLFFLLLIFGDPISALIERITVGSPDIVRRYILGKRNAHLTYSNIQAIIRKICYQSVKLCLQGYSK